MVFSKPGVCRSKQGCPWHLGNPGNKQWIKHHKMGSNLTINIMKNHLNKKIYRNRTALFSLNASSAGRILSQFQGSSSKDLESNRFLGSLILGTISWDITFGEIYRLGHIGWSYVNPVLGTTKKGSPLQPLSPSPSAREPARSRLPLPGHEAMFSQHVPLSLQQQQIDVL